MKLALVLAVLGLPWPSEAHCYHHWAYPRPQPGCGQDRSPLRGPVAHRAAEQSHDWYVEFVLPERVPNEREQGLKTLRAMLGGPQ